MMQTYRRLEAGEVIQVGDEVETSAGWNAGARWIPVQNSIGEPAPDPRFPAHRMYRRRVAGPQDAGEAHRGDSTPNA